MNSIAQQLAAWAAFYRAIFNYKGPLEVAIPHHTAYFNTLLVMLRGLTLVEIFEVVRRNLHMKIDAHLYCVENADKYLVDQRNNEDGHYAILTNGAKSAVESYASFGPCPPPKEIIASGVLTMGVKERVLFGLFMSYIGNPLDGRNEWTLCTGTSSTVSGYIARVKEDDNAIYVRPSHPDDVPLEGTAPRRVLYLAA